MSESIEPQRSEADPMTIDPSNLGSVDPLSVEGIFLVALGKSGDERAAFLSQSCPDVEQRQRVEALLTAYENAGSFLERPAVTAEPTPVGQYLAPCEVPGSIGKLGQYEILEEIGRGGMGVVFRAHDPKLQRIVAVKALAPELARLPVARQRFLREARAAAAISHPHVVTIFAVDGTEEASLGTERTTLPYLVMECIVGQTLHDKIKRVGALKTEEIIRISRQIAEGLGAAHKRGLIHRDIKPANILLENGVERVKITDFGLARTTSDGGITQTGEILGTPQCMSPEQARGELVDQRSDLFSLGCVMYTMCTGVSPFRADNMLAVMKKVCETEPRPVAQLNPNIPEWLCGLVHQLLEKAPERRVQTAGEVVEMLESRVVTSQPASPACSPIGPGFAEVIRGCWRTWIPDVIVSSAACGMVAAAMPNNVWILPTIVFFVVAWSILLYAKRQGLGNWPWVTWPLGLASLVSLYLGMMLTVWVRMETHSRSGMFVFGLAVGIFWLLTRWFPRWFTQNSTPVSTAQETTPTERFSLLQPGAHWSNALLLVTVVLAGVVGLLWTFLSRFGMSGTVREIAALVLAATAGLWGLVRFRARGVTAPQPAPSESASAERGVRPLMAVAWRSLVILVAVCFLGAVLFSVKNGIDHAMAMKNDRAFFVIRTPSHETVKYVIIDGVQATLQPGGPGEWRIETTAGRHEIHVSFAEMPPLNQVRYFTTRESVQRAQTAVITAEPVKVRSDAPTPVGETRMETSREGRFKAALALQNDTARHNTLVRLAEDAANAGDGDLVLKVIEHVDAGTARSNTCAICSEALLKRGMISAATAVAQQIEGETARSNMLARIAAAPTPALASPTSQRHEAAMLAQLQGTWVLEGKLDGDQVMVEICDNLMTWSLDTPLEPGDGKPPIFLIKLDEPGKPQPVDLTMNPNDGQDRAELPGIIEFGDDMVRICVNMGGSGSGDATRPAVFANGKAAELWTLRRPLKQSLASLGAQLAPAPVGPEELKDTPFRGGLRIAKVYAGTPAAEGGLLAGDILVGLGAWEVAKLEDLQYALGLSLEGEVSFHILRDGQVRKGYVLLDGSKRPVSDAELSPEQLVKLTYEYQRGHSTPDSRSADTDGSQPPTHEEFPSLGVHVFRKPVSALEFQIDSFRSGLRINHVIPGSLAATGGMLVGDILVCFHDWEITTPEELRYALSQGLTGEVPFHIVRDGIVHGSYVVIDQSKLPGTDTGLSTVQQTKVPRKYHPSQIFPKHRSELEGHWKLESFTLQDGTPQDFKLADAPQLEIHGNEVFYDRGRNPSKIEIDAEWKTLKYQKDSEDEPSTYRYMLKGDQLTLRNAGDSLLVYRRQAAPPSTAQATELEGNWHRVSVTAVDGTPIETPHFNVTIRGTTWTNQIGQTPEVIKFQTNLEKKTIEFSNTPPVLYAFDLDGNRLILRDKTLTMVLERGHLPAVVVAPTELEGDWHLETDGKVDQPPNNLTIHGDQYTVSSPNDSYTLRMTLDPKARTIQLASTTDAEVLTKSTYELHGDRLTMRSGDPPQVNVWSRGHRSWAVTELEGDWHLAGEHVEQGMVSEIQIRPSNLTIRGDKFIEAWSGHQMEYRLEADPKTGEIRKYSLHEEPSFQPEKYERQGDRLILRDIQNRQNYLIYKRGHVRLQVALPQVTDTQRQKWRSGIVELFAEWNDEKTGTQQKPIGYGTVISDQGWVVGQVERIGPDTRKYIARCDDGSLVRLDLKEDDVNGGWYVFQAQSSTQFNHAFPIALTETEVGDAVWAYPTNSTFPLITATVKSKDRRVVASGRPVWQLDRDTNSGEYSETKYGSLPVLNGNGELLGLSMVGTGELSLALPVSQFKTVFTKSLGQLPDPTAPVEPTEPAEPTEADQVRWKSAVVDIVVYGKSDALDGGGERVLGRGVVVSENGLILTHLAGGWASNLHDWKILAKFDDGSQVDLTVAEGGGAGLVALQAKDVVSVNHYFPISAESYSVGDEVYFGQKVERAFGKSKIILTDRKITTGPSPVWQLEPQGQPDVFAGQPVLSSSGKLVGLTLQGTGELLLAVPVNLLKEMFPKTLGPMHAAVPPPPPAAVPSAAATKPSEEPQAGEPPSE